MWYEDEANFSIKSVEIQSVGIFWWRKWQNWKVMTLCCLLHRSSGLSLTSFSKLVCWYFRNVLVSFATIRAKLAKGLRDIVQAQELSYLQDVSRGLYFASIVDGVLWYRQLSGKWMWSREFMMLEKNSHCFNLTVVLALKSRVNLCFMSLVCAEPLKNITMSSRYSTASWRRTIESTTSTARWNVPDTILNPNGIQIVVHDVTQTRFSLLYFWQCFLSKSCCTRQGSRRCWRLPMRGCTPQCKKRDCNRTMEPRWVLCSQSKVRASCLFRCENNWGFPLGLTRLDDLEL